MSFEAMLPLPIHGDLYDDDDQRVRPLHLSPNVVYRVPHCITNERRQVDDAVCYAIVYPMYETGGDVDVDEHGDKQLPEMCLRYEGTHSRPGSDASPTHPHTRSLINIRFAYVCIRTGLEMHGLVRSMYNFVNPHRQSPAFFFLSTLDHLFALSRVL